MARKKRTKNMRIRRQVKRTIAAILMIMAVIVAAIPVERYGTLQASTETKTNLNIDNLYNWYMDYHKANEYDKSTGKGDFKLTVPDAADYYMTGDSDYNGVISGIKRVQNNNILYWKYQYKDRVVNGITNAVIVKYNDNYLEPEITLNSSMPKDYWVFTNGLITAFVKSAGGAGEKVGIKVRMTTRTESTDVDTVTSIEMPDTLVYEKTENIKSGTILFDTGEKDQKIYQEIYNENGTSNKITYSAELNVDEFFEKYENSFSDYKELKKRKEEYEKRIAALNSDLEKAKATQDADSKKTQLQTVDANAKALIKEINNETSVGKSMNIEYTPEIIAHNLGDLMYDYLGQRISIYDSQRNTISLKNDYVFEEVIDTNHFSDGTSNQVTVRVPRYVGTGNPSNVDEDGYVYYGQVGVCGIGNKAFQNAAITKVTLSNQFEFIGNEAFIGCSNLNSLTVQNCKVIGNRAFAGCNIRNVSFTGEDGKGSALQEIGAGAFTSCNQLNTISFPNSIRQIDAGAFANCTNLREIHFDPTTSNDVAIWPFAFYNCSSLADTGDGEEEGSFFFRSDFANTLTIGLGAFAVNNSGGNMKEFIFPQSMNKIIKPTSNPEFDLGGDKSFYKAISTKIPSKFKDMTAENYVNADEFMYDFILAGRSGLEHVTFPANMKSNNKNTSYKIPDNTLMGCSNLNYVTMGQISCDEAYGNAITFDTPSADSDKDGETLFQDIKNKNFYVEGPGYFDTVSKTPTAPRKATWGAETNNLNEIPYLFLDEDGKECLEIATGEGKYLASIVIMDENQKTAKLISFISNPNISATDSLIRELTIPETVAGYHITDLGAGCFKDVSDKVLEFTIQDNSIENLEAEAFKGSKTLLQVNIGNSVKNIGDRAFADCNKLENIYFSEPLNVSDNSSTAEWENVLSIGTDAFATKSDYLTFHGPIHSGYQPYEYAMEGNTLSSTSKRNICYKTDTPMNLTVLYDNKTGMPTCVDYPHYEDLDNQNGVLIQDLIKRYIDNYEAQGLDTSTIPGNTSGTYSIMKKFEQKYGFRTDATDYDSMALEQDEEDTALYTFFMMIPDGVKSIDAKGYLNATENSANLPYMNIYYTEKAEAATDCIKRETDTSYSKRGINPSGNGNVKDLYSSDLAATDSKATVNRAGLFSGMFDENVPNNVIENAKNFTYGSIDHKMVEEVPTGNDNLLSMTLKSVEELPSYAFNSCENLLWVDLGEKCKQTGLAPFRGCSSLTDIVGNDVLVYDNGILYQAGPVTAKGEDYDYTIPDGKYRVIEALESRGDEVGQKTVTPTNDPMLNSVASLSEEAFAYCEDIKELDLSESTITTIPESCFEGAKNLRTIHLPDTVESIEKDAFKNCDNLYVEFDSPYCTIREDAFDGASATFIGDEFTDSSEEHKSPIYTYYSGNGNVVDFQSKERSYTVKFYDHNAELIDVQVVTRGDDAKLPSNPERAGFTFEGWAWDQDKDLSTTTDVITGDAAYKKIEQDRILVAQYKVKAGFSDGKSYTLKIVGGTATGYSGTEITVPSGSIVTINADAAQTGQRFAYWSADTSDVAFTQAYLESTTFSMPTSNCTVTANYVNGSGIVTNPNDNNGNNNNNNGNSGNNNNNNSTDKKDGEYKLTVNYGSGSGKYDAGEVVSISAYAPESSSKVFSHWSTTTSEVGFASTTSSSTTIVMPKKDTVVTANYKTRSSSSDDDDDEDDDLRSRHPATTSTTTTTNRTTNTGTAPATGNNNGNGNNNNNGSNVADNGTRLDISKNGISNKDVGSASVSGSTDNFVVKISDSADAKAAVEAALIDKYGSLDNIAYFPMDISLYDTSGKNKITDTSGLSVSITLPIPDELIQYGGNNIAGAVSNNRMEDLVARFTTIDGIGCITFTATHFSPYAIYVDTQNLVAGQTMDATPKTGDGIHPKWFLAIALACMSVILFAVSDKKKTKTVHA